VLGDREFGELLLRGLVEKDFHGLDLALRLFLFLLDNASHVLLFSL
jgi:hypothetical protein